MPNTNRLLTPQAIRVLTKEKGLKVIIDKKPSCPKCGDSEGVSRCGLKYTTESVTQKYRCDKCGTHWLAGGNVWRRHFSGEVIGYALNRIKAGATTRDVSTEINGKFKLYVSHGTIAKWAVDFIPGFRFPKWNKGVLGSNTRMGATARDVSLSWLAEETGCTYAVMRDVLADAEATRLDRSRQELVRRLAMLEAQRDSIIKRIEDLKVRLA